MHLLLGMKYKTIEKWLVSLSAVKKDQQKYTVRICLVNKYMVWSTWLESATNNLSPTV